MRRFEKIISLVAVIGVLLHAGLLVRHNGIMLDAAFDRLALSFAGGIICHGAGDGAQPGSGLPDRPAKAPNCPVCVGAGVSAAILPTAIATLDASPNIHRHSAAVDQHFGRHSGGFRPPSRAPPATI